jgi:lipase
MNDPFRSTDTAPVAGGMLAYGEAGPAAGDADSIVLALHGITGNRMMWRSVAHAMQPESRIGLLAPDLRGRGDSAGLPGPYGMAAHVADVLALLDHVGIARVVVAGHSMGAYVAARLAAEHPERISGLVLVDVPLRDLNQELAAAARAMAVGPAVLLRTLTYASTESYVNFWRLHPAFAHAWNDDIEAYVLHDLGGESGARRYAANIAAIEADADEMLCDQVNRSAIDQVHAPVHLLRAPRGAFDDDNPVILRADVEAFILGHPGAEVEEVPGVNHYTVVLGDGVGPGHVAAAILAAVNRDQNPAGELVGRSRRRPEVLR